MRSLRSVRVVLALVAAGSTGIAAACARQGAPPGGPEDRRPPVVVSTEPAPFAELTEPFRGPVKFRFDERVSERVSNGTLDDAVLVSPRTGEVRVGHGRQDISVDISGGFRPGLVYRVTLLPVLRDLFNNEMRDPFEIVFSTGGALTASALGGLVWDRTTGEGVRDFDVYAVATDENGDSIVHVAKTDTGGVYVFRYLPPSRYNLLAFEDRNRNGVADRMEVQGTRSFLITGADTAILPVGVLQPDTTPARLTRATPLDSITLLLEFDDFLDPTVSAAQIGVSLSREDGEAPGVDLAFHEGTYLEWRRAVEDSLARLDSLDAAARMAARRAAAAAAATDSAGADTTVSVPPATRPPDRPGMPPGVAAGDTAGAGRPAVRIPPPDLPASAPGTGAPTARRGGGRGGADEGPLLNPDGHPLPATRVVLRLDRPLEPNVAYQLSVNVVLNLNGLPLGGGEAAVVLEPPEDTTSAPDTAAADTAAVQPPDTASAPPDTGFVAADRSGGVARVPFLPGRRW
jgi:hypothetical protein